MKLYTLKYLVTDAQQNQREIRPGLWAPARPVDGPWIWRVRAAWAVLCGRADAFTWPETEETPHAD